tara:strand:- start:487 stop:1275 length:789 start_codon:yes stop_codon:yes gene_type:complete
MDDLSDKNQQSIGFMKASFGFCVLILSLGFSLVLIVVSVPKGIAFSTGLLALLLLLCASLTAERRILNSLPGRRIVEGEHPRITNLVEGLCLSTGISPPHIHILPTEGRNVAAFGTSVNGSTLIITTGLLEAATRIELEAVLANRISQIVTYRTALATVAAATFGLAIGPPSFQTRPFALISPKLKRKIGLQVDPSHDFSGDVAGTGITRYPPGMVEAIEMAENKTVIPETSPTLDAFWLFPSKSETNRPSIEARATVLREM